MLANNGNGGNTIGPKSSSPESFIDNGEELSDPDEQNEKPQDNTKSHKPVSSVVGAASGDVDVDDVSNFINFNKYLTKNSANYYYSQKNRDVREKLQKVKKSRQNSTDFDSSVHTDKGDILLERTLSSSYKGQPQRLKSDGSTIKPALKTRRGSSFSVNISTDGSVESTPSAPIKRNITLMDVHIREHERVAGDNPCVTSGVPLSIGWGYVQHKPIPLDLYEKSKGPSRDKIEMMVPAAIRKSILRDEFDVSVKDLNEAIKNVNVTKRNRRSTVAGEHMEGLGEVVESVKRKLLRVLKKTTNEKEEQKLWAQAQKAAVKSK